MKRERAHVCTTAAVILHRSDSNNVKWLLFLLPTNLKHFCVIFFQHTETLPTSGLAWELQRSGGLSKCYVFSYDWKGTHGKIVLFGAGGSHVNRALEFSSIVMLTLLPCLTSHLSICSNTHTCNILMMCQSMEDVKV